MTVKKRRSGNRERAAVAELHADRRDANWDGAPLEAEVLGQRAVITSLRLPVAEFAALQKAAKASGQSVSEYIRNAIALRLHGGGGFNTIHVATGSSEARSHTTVRLSAFATEGARTENPGPGSTRDWACPNYANL
jgi:hypothetical protein